MNPAHFLAEIALVCLAALVGGLAARKLRQPVILGYLLAGVLVGPNTPGYVADIGTVSVIAEWGVVFLLFAVGIEFSFRFLLKAHRAVVAGLLQVLATALVGYALGQAMGLSSSGSVLLGMVIALSSTMVVLRMLDERGESESQHGSTMLAILITQDLLVVLFVAVVPVLATFSASQVPVLFGRVLLGTALLAVATVLALKALPWVFQAIAATRSRELFILALVGIAFGAAVGTEKLGFSLALGAFVAGLIVSESEYSHLILAEVKPFRDFFAAVFFVSIGMLARPEVPLRDPWAISVLVVAVVVGKFLITGALLLALGMSARTSVIAGLGLAQIGEFSFVLAQLGVASGAASERLYGLTVMAAVITLFATPLLVRFAPRLAVAVSALPFASRREPQEAPPVVTKSGHVILCGYGRVGSRLGRAAATSGMDVVVVDFDPDVAGAARTDGFTAIYGDASNPEIIRAAGAISAAAAAVTVPDPVAASLAVQSLKDQNGELTVVARAHSREDVQRLRNSGADAVVWPELEAGIEMIRQLAARLGKDPEEMVAGAREHEQGEP